MNHEIPGMYWDNVKKKYFAIQPNHVAPAGTHYNVDRVKKLKCERETALAHAKNMETRKGLIRRSEASRDPLVGGLMSRELGRVHGHDQDTVVRTLSQGLEEQVILRSEEDMLAEIGFPMQTSSTVYIADFDYDVVTGSLFLPVRKACFCWIMGGRPRGSPPSRRIYFSRQNAKIVWPSYGNISSININPYNRLMLTTWLMAGQNAEMFMTKLEGPCSEELLSRSDPTHAETASVRLRPLHGDIPVSCATYANPSSGSSFVLGSKRGLLLIDEDSRTSELRVRNSDPSDIAQKDILAVECSKDSPFVIFSGDRKGALQFLDVRRPTKAASIIQHASSVCHIKHVRDGIIAVSGLKSTLCNYDQRFLKNRPLAESWPEIHHDYSQQTLNVTAPVFTYTKHENDVWTEAGFDIDVNAGIAAAAQTGTSTAVKIFSLKTGRLLRSMDSTGVGCTVDLDLARVVKFVPDPFGGMGRDLWVAKGSRIVSYAW